MASTAQNLWILQLLEEYDQTYVPKFLDMNVEEVKSDSQCALKRDEAASRLSEAGPPPEFRLIDCRATCDRNKVVLVDWQQHCHMKYTAISHTWGEDAYAVFKCECASDSSACTTPRCHTQPCPYPGGGPEAHAPPHAQVIRDILNMCHCLLAEASEGRSEYFLWHDGVCIAQHNSNEVSETIKHMGWVYASASDTVIFLHNVGNPMSLLPLHKPYETRWNRRVWTLQEAVLSRRRRYCIRLLHFDDCEPLAAVDRDFFKGPYESEEEFNEAKLAYGGPQYSSATLRKDFETKLEQCYEDDSCIAVIEEESLWRHLGSLYAQVRYLSKWMLVFPSETANVRHFVERETYWIQNLQAWMLYLLVQCFAFPEQLYTVLWSCARDRESKHEGDRLNSLLGLAGITDFNAPKDGDFEASTIIFLQRVAISMGREHQTDLLLSLLFAVNLYDDDDQPEAAAVVERRHTWLPCVSRVFLGINGGVKSTECIDRRGTAVVLKENGMLKLIRSGHCMCCIAVKFIFRNDANTGLDPTSDPSSSSTVHRCAENSDEYYEQLYRDCSMFTMDIYNEWPNVSLRALAHDSDAELGKVLFPFNEKLGTPVFHGRGGAMNQGSSISAHLLFDILNSHALIVQFIGGDNSNSAAPVSKLGVFEVLNPNLLIFLRDKHPFPIAYLTELIVQ